MIIRFFQEECQTRKKNPNAHQCRSLTWKFSACVKRYIVLHIWRQTWLSTGCWRAQFKSQPTTLVGVWVSGRRQPCAGTGRGWNRFGNLDLRDSWRQPSMLLCSSLNGIYTRKLVDSFLSRWFMSRWYFWLKFVCFPENKEWLEFWKDTFMQLFALDFWPTNLSSNISTWIDFLARAAATPENVDKNVSGSWNHKATLEGKKLAMTSCDEIWLLRPVNHSMLRGRMTLRNHQPTGWVIGCERPSLKSH